MIYTLTTNPSIDYYIYQDKEITNGINRPDNCEFVAAGKGVNVSKMLSTLGVENTCVIVIGGFTGKYIYDEICKEKLIKVVGIEVEQESRVNVKARHGANLELDLNTKGPYISEKAKNNIYSKFCDLKQNDVVLINGTIQKEVIDVVKDICQLANEKGAKVFLDVPNLSLEQIVDCKPFLIKPNEEEIKKMLNTDLNYPEVLDVIKQKLTSKGINVMLSLGKDGSVYLDKENSYRIVTKELQPINTVGAGDSLLAGFVSKFVNNCNIEEILRFASATGSAAVMSKQLPSIKEIESHLDEVNLKYII